MATRRWRCEHAAFIFSPRCCVMHAKHSGQSMKTFLGIREFQSLFGFFVAPLFLVLLRLILKTRYEGAIVDRHVSTVLTCSNFHCLFYFQLLGFWRCSQLSYSCRAKSGLYLRHQRKRGWAWSLSSASCIVFGGDCAQSEVE